jgi:CRP/FNR family transcriptional regulator, cyclic AMP receptor protein
MPSALNMLDEERSRILGRVRQAGLPGEFVDEVASDNIAVRYSKRTRLFVQGAPADLLMLVLNGVVKVQCKQPDGRRFLAELAGPGDVIGYADRCDTKGRHCQVFEAEALTNCAVALITRQRIMRLLEECDRATLLSLFERLNTFWASIVHRYAKFLTLSYSERLEAMLSEIASRFGVRDARGTLITLELGHEDWAAMIGSSRPMASRLLADMARHRLLTREGKRYILFADSRPEGPNLGALGNGAAHKPGATAARPRASA